MQVFGRWRLKSKNNSLQSCLTLSKSTFTLTSLPLKNTTKISGELSKIMESIYGSEMNLLKVAPQTKEKSMSKETVGDTSILVMCLLRQYSFKSRTYECPKNVTFMLHTHTHKQNEKWKGKSEMYSRKYRNMSKFSNMNARYIDPCKSKARHQPNSKQNN